MIDFDAAVRDPNDPQRIDPQYDGGDHLHFNLAGYKKMGETVDLAKLARPQCAERLAVRVSKHHLTAGVATTVRVVVRRGGKPVRRARVRLGAFKAKTNRRGIARLRVHFTKPGRRTLAVSAKDAPRATVTIRVRKQARVNR